MITNILIAVKHQCLERKQDDYNKSKAENITTTKQFNVLYVKALR